ncbi:MAG: DUF4838 domain-containing protein [Ruminococcaceae bacterium]|nr:DUF4838 domain-containing protein [Oscillospiraceae bacterium]
MIITSNGRCHYTVAASRDADETVRYAANELTRFLYTCTGAPTPVLSDLCVYARPEIRIGRDVRNDPFYATVDYDALGDEGYLIQANAGNLYILGRSSRGTLYGVYAFLEKYLGCRWFAPGVSRLPRVSEVIVPDDVKIVETPAFEYRDAYWGCAFDGEFCARNRLNSAKALLTPEQGGKMHWNKFHHACLDLVPKDIWFESHPEFYSEVDGVRRPDQLCLTNPEMRKVALETLKGWIRDNPHTTVFSIAQNDNRNYCRCERCRALDEAEGSPAATNIDFANYLADAIAEEYPHVLLHTFAYQYTITPPATIRPRRNVIVRLCNIGADFSRPFAEGRDDPGTEQFMSALDNWKAISDRLHIWDYCTNFRHYLLPFPNIHCLQPNIRTYRDAGVKGVFMEGDFSHGCAAHLCELQAYLQARLMWNPDIDYELEMDVFLSGFYGVAAPYIRRYIDLLEPLIAGHRLSIYENPASGFITDEFITEAARLFDEAMLAAENPDVRRRVERTKLCIDYLRVTRLPMDYPGRDGLIDAFGQRCRDLGVTEITERGYLDLSIDSLKAKQYGAAIRDPEYYLWMYYRM